MNKLIAVGIIIALSVNATIIVVGVSYLENEINQLKNEESDLPVTPTATEPESIAEPTPESEPEPQPTPEPEPIPEPTPQEATEPEDSELKPEMIAPEVNLTAYGINDNEAYEHLDIYLQGTIVNPNSRPIFNVSITVEFKLTLVQMIYPTPNPYPNPKETITIGTMRGNQVVQISESFEKRNTHTGYYTLNYFTYTVNWNESK